VFKLIFKMLFLLHLNSFWKIRKRSSW